MANRSLLWIRMMGAMMLMALVGTAQANIWLDENFEDDEAFVQHNGTVPGENGWDTYSTNPLLSEVTATTGYAETGTVTSDKAFQGSKSYRIDSTQTLEVGPEYQDSQHGNFQIFQFAINVDPIPEAGSVATFRWDHDMNSVDPEPDHSFYVRLESDGLQVDIIGGEDLANEQPVEGSLGTLTSTSDWAYITVLVQKNDVAESDTRFPFLGNVEQGVYFFNSSLTPAFVAVFVHSEPTTYAARGWSFKVDSGAIYLDDLYWDGGMDDDPATSNFRPFDLGGVPVTSKDWMIIQ